MSADADVLFLRHTVATLGYRAAKAVRDAPDGFGSFAGPAGTRTPVQILAHMGDLLDWALYLADGTHVWRESSPLPWNQEVARFFSRLEAFDRRLESEQPLGHPVERLFQGPVADALCHTGQLTMLRRSFGAPVRGENYFKAAIEKGRIGLDQNAPRVEFD